MKQNTPKINQGYDNMDDLISRKAAMKAVEEYVRLRGMPPSEYATNVIKRLPSVHAVPLDKLCKWLAKNAILKCNACREYFKNCYGSCGDSSEHWEIMLTKWMEEVNKNDA